MNHPLMAGFPVVVENPVVWGEMDSYRHVNNVVYFRCFENARLEYFRRLDWFDYEQKTGVGPILSAVQARFRKPLTYPDRVWTGARVGTVGEDRFTLHHLVVSERLNAVVTEGQSTIVTYRYSEGRKVAVPPDLLGRIQELEDSAS